MLQETQHQTIEKIFLHSFLSGFVQFNWWQTWTTDRVG